MQAAKKNLILYIAVAAIILVVLLAVIVNNSGLPEIPEAIYIEGERHFAMSGSMVYMRGRTFPTPYVSGAGAAYLRVEDKDLKLSDMLIREGQKYDLEAVPAWRGFREFVNNPAKKQEVADRIKYLVERYDGDGVDDMRGLEKPIKYWQLGNEWDGWTYWDGTASEFVGYLKLAYNAVKSADPDAKIILGGIAAPHLSAFVEGYIEQEKIEFFDQQWTRDEILNATFNGHIYNEHSERINYVLENGRDYYDIVDLHHYWKPEYVHGEVSWLKDRLQEIGKDAEIVSTEVGWMVSKKYQEASYYSEEKQAAMVVRQLVGLLGNGVKQVYWFGIKDTTTEIELCPVYWGLMRKDAERNVKKPSYYTYRMLVEKLDGFDSAEDLSTSDYNLYMFTKKDRDVFVAWAEKNAVADLSNYTNTGNLEISYIVTGLDNKNNPVYKNPEIVDAGFVNIGEVPVIIEVA